jgi:predicted GH43/DUF377 family glycosyl hydrolase
MTTSAAIGGELFQRHPGNPILTASDWPYPVNSVFNPAAAVVDGETLVLARVEDLRGISHLTVARSANGVDGWTVDPEPLLAPSEGIESEEWGFEDPRAVWLPELECWAITCTAYGPHGPAVYLATTTDFKTVERCGVIKRAEDKNAALLPERVDGKWILFHRPSEGAVLGSGGEIVLSRSDDLLSWSAPEPVMAPRAGAWWDSRRIGIGPPPLRTEHGWLIIYHGVKDTVAGGLYRVGLALTALDEPTRVTHRVPNWILGARTKSERTGDVPNAVFPCGLVHDEETGLLRLYYGAADTSIGLATARLDDLLVAVLASPA